MAATPLCAQPLAALKNSLRDEFPHVKSSHLSEALAYSLGFRTYAALQAAMVGLERDRPFILLDSRRFMQRLMQIGYENDTEFDFEMTISNTTPGAVSTIPASAYEIQYKTTRQKAWRNLMVCAINAALDRHFFSLRPGDNRFSDKKDTFDFDLPNGLPAKCFLFDAGFDEIGLHAAVNPKGSHVHVMAEFEVGDAVGMAWLERQRGVWMQSSYDQFHCRKKILAELATLSVEPKGYGDRGRVIM